MRFRCPLPQSKHLAAGILVTAVIIMLTPLRSGPRHTQQASFVPLLSAGGVGESSAFRSLSSASPVNASATPLVRAPVEKK